MHLSTVSPAGAEAPTSVATSLREFLAFKLGSEEYGIDILRVQEIRSYEEPVRFVNAPAFVKGVLNLRGVIVPIIDMRLKFALAECRYDTFTVIIVLTIAGRVVGMVVDAVSDVITLTPDQLRPVPALRGGVAEDSLLAIGTIADRMLILVDIEKMIASPDMGLIEALPGAVPALPALH